MKLSGLLDRGAVLQLDAPADKWEVIRALVDRLKRTPFAEELEPGLTDSFLPTIEGREELASTGVEQGVAFPHARITGLERPLVAFAALGRGVDFGAPDGIPTRLVFLVLLPASRVQLGVKIHAVCSRFLAQEKMRAALLAAEDPEGILAVIDSHVEEIDAPVIALDLMRAERLRLTPELPIRQAVQRMHACRNVVAPVVDPEGRVIGELSCTALFKRELPDYITRLHSVPPISDFHPFRRYFDRNADLAVGQFMSVEPPLVDENAPLLEIIFMLSVRKHPMLYVCRENRLIGVIDAITVLDKVLNL